MQSLSTTGQDKSQIQSASGADQLGELLTMINTLVQQGGFLPVQTSASPFPISLESVSKIEWGLPHPVEPLLVDTKTACALLSVKRTKLFSMLNQTDGLKRIKLGRKTLIAMDSIRAVAARGDA